MRLVHSSAICFAASAISFALLLPGCASASNDEAATDESALASSYTCSISDVSNGLRVTAFLGSARQYYFQVGAGGALDEMVDGEGRTFLAPQLDNVTDRVIQWVDFAYEGSLKVAGTGDRRFNVNQAGTHENGFSPIATITVDKANCAIDVWSSPQVQWHSELQKEMQGSFTSYVRYQVGTDGAIMVHRAVYLGSIDANGALYNGVKTTGAIDELKDFWLKDWHPISSARFSRVALGLAAQSNGTASVTSSYHATTDTKTGTYFEDVANTAGYVVAYNPAKPSSPAIGVAYGTEHATCAGTCSVGITNVEVGTCGSADVVTLDPVVTGDVHTGSIIDHTYYIVPSNAGLTSAFANTLQAHASSSSGPAIYGGVANADLPADLQPIAAQLVSNFGAPATIKTNKLGAWAK